MSTILPKAPAKDEMGLLERLRWYGFQLLRAMPTDCEWALVMRLRGGGQRSFTVGNARPEDTMAMLKETVSDQRSKTKSILEA